MKKARIYILLHILIVVYSMCGIFSKTASQYPFLSIPFCLCYAGVIGVLGIYAIGWQQVIKRIPLTIAFANKAVTVVWGLIFGVLFFHEQVTLGKLVGSTLVVLGVILYVGSDREENHDV